MTEPPRTLQERQHVGETCADCGREIGMFEGSYYRKGPADDIGKVYHSSCGDPFGTKAMEAEISKLRQLLAEAREALEPMARAADELDEYDSADIRPEAPHLSITTDDFRNARAVLAKLKAASGEG